MVLQARRKEKCAKQWQPDESKQPEKGEESEEFCSFSAIGNLKTAEVDPGRHFVKILNYAPAKDESIGDYLLKQEVQGQPMSVFRFLPETRMRPNSTVTAWAADATVLHKPPSDFLWKELKRFRTTSDCATVLREPTGQLDKLELVTIRKRPVIFINSAVARFTPLYWNRRQGWVVKEETEKFENIVIPTFSTTKQKEGWGNEQEFTITDTE
ncbi:PREDICTED: lamin tail domain-containing protein 1 [Leptosomus discolor]|uniref:lamin tail domain-containing protein 1 n=1 Tax=Leptosomus discolor TaxID=188344 RepID=UPI000522AAC4|nr:PREDICTED: lamin tail domain-containing protein 1 [Leptosomus discolor]